MTNATRATLAMIATTLFTTTAYAGAASSAPELDASSVASGVGLASAVVLLLTRRGSGRASNERDEKR